MPISLPGDLDEKMHKGAVVAICGAQSAHSAMYHKYPHKTCSLLALLVLTESGNILRSLAIVLFYIATLALARAWDGLSEEEAT